MSTTSILLTGLMLVAMAAFFAPSIIAMNRGNNLRNIALWLGIFLGLALIYQNFGPNSGHPLFRESDTFATMRQENADDAAKDEPSPAPEDKDADTGENGFTPPKE